MNNFRHIEVINVNFFSRCSKFYLDLQNGIKPPENVDGFENNCVWTCGRSFFQLWQEYMWSDMNVIKSEPKFSDSTKRHNTKLNLFDINGTLA